MTGKRCRWNLANQRLGGSGINKSDRKQSTVSYQSDVKMARISGGVLNVHQLVDKGRRTMPDKIILDSLERKRKAAAARVRFEKATLDMASEQRFGGPDAASTEIEISEEATRLVKETRVSK